MTKNKQKLFWAKVNKTNKCWEWTAALHDSGYGIFGFEKKKVDRAHRISFRLLKGKIPRGVFVCHTCDNRKCVNPDHLFLGTNQDNVNDMIAKKRNSLPPNMGGWNKIDIPAHIIDLLGKRPDTELANKLSVNKSTIRRAREKLNIPAYPCQTRFKTGNPHPRWGRNVRISCQR